MKLLRSPAWRQALLFIYFFFSPVYAQLTFTNTNWDVVIGQPFTISWTYSGSDAPTSVTLTLVSGPSTNLATVEVIASGLKASGSYTWTPASSIDTSTQYALKIVDDTGDTNYSAVFTIGAGSGGVVVSASSSAASILSSAAAPASSTATLSTVISVIESSTSDTPTSSTAISSASSQTPSSAQSSIPSSTKPSSSSQTSIPSSSTSTTPPNSTTPASNTTTSPSTAAKGKKSGLSAGAAAGIAIAGILGLLALIALAWFLIRRRRKSSPEAEAEAEAAHPAAPELSAGEKTLAHELGPPLSTAEEQEWRARKRAAELEGKSAVVAELGVEGNPRAELEALRRAAVYEM